jgi:hypothetical protein
MRKPILRFRAFLLLTTLASLVAATAGIRIRLAGQEFVEDHDFYADRARTTAERGWQEALRNSIEEVKSAETEEDVARNQELIDWIRNKRAEAAAEAERHDRLIRKFEIVAPR